MKNSSYDISLIRKYLNGELDARAMFELERKAQEDPLLIDLMKGMESGDEVVHQNALTDIHDLIDDRTKSDRDQPLFPWRTFGIAASFLIILGIAGLFLVNDKPVQKIVKQKSQLKETIEAPAIKSAEPDTALASSDVLVSQTPSNRSNGLRKAYEESVRADSPSTLLAAVQPQTEMAEHNLDEVVIVGYGSQKKSDLTGSVSSPALTAPDAALAGRVPGVQIRIRGRSSLERERQPYTVTGTVVDAKGKDPLPGVTVKVKGTDIVTTTDANGTFTITLPGEGETIETAYLGYETGILKPEKEKDLTIALQPSSSALSEVVVVGYGTDKETEEIKEAHPAEGWSEFRKYLRRNTKAAKNESAGVVIISFTVSPLGELSDAKIIKGINDTANKRALDLLLNGPKWVGDKDGAAKVIKLRIRFYK